LQQVLLAVENLELISGAAGQAEDPDSWFGVLPVLEENAGVPGWYVEAF